MKKILPILVIGFFVLSGLGAVALECDIETSNEQYIAQEPTDDGGRDYTHTVLVEVGSSSTCPACPASNIAWHTIYESGNYDFEYCEMVGDMVPVRITLVSGCLVPGAPVPY